MASGKITVKTSHKNGIQLYLKASVKYYGFVYTYDTNGKNAISDTAIVEQLSQVNIPTHTHTYSIQ